MASPIKTADPLLQPPSQVWAIWAPTALKEAVEAEAKVDGYRSASGYAVDLLAWAVNARRAERLAQKKK